MDNKILIFSGMPASGKDTVTKELCKNSKYVALKKYRSIDDSVELKDTYYNISREEFEQKIKAGVFLQYHIRYDRYYGIAKDTLLQLIAEDMIPIIHIGRIENFYNFVKVFNQLLLENNIKCQIIHIMLWERLDVLKERISKRETDLKEQQKRIEAAKQEFQDNKLLLDRNENPYSYIILNSDKERTCRKINEIVINGNCDIGTGYEEFMKYVLITEDLNREGEENTSNKASIFCKKELSNYNIKNRYFTRNVSIEDIRNDRELVFENCVFEDVKLSEVSCKEVRFIQCEIKGELRIFKGKIQTINIRSCRNITRLIIEEANDLKEGSTLGLKVTDSNIGELKVFATQFSSIDFNDVNSSCGSINFIRGGNVEQLKISCKVEKLIIKSLPKIILSKEGKIEAIELEDIDKKILRKYEKEIIDYNKNSHIDDEFLRYKSIVLAAYEVFESKKMFLESDICLFEIRRLGILIKKANKPIPINILLSIEKFLAEDCFGWGINIINNIITMFCVIVGFSGIYYVIARVKGEETIHLSKCFEIAMNRFFLIGSDEFNYAFLPYMDSIESIMGVVLLTVITGVLVRKIIR